MTVGIIKYHLIYRYRNIFHIFNQILFIDILSEGGRKQDGILFHHVEIVAEVTSEENGAHVAVEEEHGGAGDVFCVEEVEIDGQSGFELQGVFGVELASVDIGNFGKSIEYKFFGEGGAVDRSIIPAWGQSFIVIGMEMREEMDESLWGVAFTEIEIINEDVCIGYYPGHSIILIIGEIFRYDWDNY